jgi:hypothetical protein
MFVPLSMRPWCAFWLPLFKDGWASHGQSWVLEKGSFILEIIHVDNSWTLSPFFWESPGIECRWSVDHRVPAAGSLILGDSVTRAHYVPVVLPHMADKPVSRIDLSQLWPLPSAAIDQLLYMALQGWLHPLEWMNKTEVNVTFIFLKIQILHMRENMQYLSF